MLCVCPRVFWCVRACVCAVRSVAVFMVVIKWGWQWLMAWEKELVDLRLLIRTALIMCFKWVSAILPVLSVLFSFSCAICSVASHSDENKMHATNLATVFGPNLLKPEASSDDMDMSAALDVVSQVGAFLLLFSSPRLRAEHHPCNYVTGHPIGPTTESLRQAHYVGRIHNPSHQESGLWKDLSVILQQIAPGIWYLKGKNLFQKIRKKCVWLVTKFCLHVCNCCACAC